MVLGRCIKSPSPTACDKPRVARVPERDHVSVKEAWIVLSLSWGQCPLVISLNFPFLPPCALLCLRFDTVLVGKMGRDPAPCLDWTCFLKDDTVW